MSINSARDLLQAAQKSGLLTVAEIDRVGEEFDTQRVSTAPEAAARLVQSETLTLFQIERLLAGRGEECVIAQRYRITEKLGEGAMGAVFSAVDNKLDRTVAIKVLPPHSLDDPDAVTRFQREAKALAKLSHPNIIQAYDVGEDRGRHFVVMEYIEGSNLHKLLVERGPLPPARAADYICQAALGLQHAHEKGLVHRDLKPSNLIVTPDRQVKIVDLGLARFFQDHLHDPHLTREGIGMGTPDYMPPEQFHDARTADPRADIYSLGCTFYQMLAGEVPFPGSSISEKCRAHEERTPPLEEKCPDVPAGMIEVVLRMMAKAPAARYQSALDVAHALAPHVAGSSASSLRIKATSSWQGSAALPSPAKAARRFSFNPRLVMLLGAAAALLIASPIVVPQLFDPVSPSQTVDGAGGSAGIADSAAKGGAALPTVITIPNGLTVAKDGTGQYTSIREALEKVAAGQTIRVLDDAQYEESLSITSRSAHSGVTLEAVQGATVHAVLRNTNLVEITGVPGFTLRGFKLRSTGGMALVLVKHDCPGLTLENLNLSRAEVGIDVLGGNLANEDLPMMLRDCEIADMTGGIKISGKSTGYSTPLAVSRIAIRQNTIRRCTYAIGLMGDVRQVQVVGNQVMNAGGYGIQLENLIGSPKQILIANNTLFESTFSLRLWDLVARGKQIEVRNNLFLASNGPDMAWLDNGGTQQQVKGPGDGASLAATWQLSHNWRETQPPTDPVLSKAWIPPTPNDVRQDAIAVLSREVGSPDFLRPAADSPLATGGAGAEISDLPKYIGAVPPAGAKPWDWQTTWDARHKHLFTVSQDPQQGGEFRTIGAALEQVRPGRTIRVLDAATYSESIVFDDPIRHAGVTLESPQQATLGLSTASDVVLIQNVPGVKLSGFRFGETGSTSFANCVRVTGDSQGVVLENLHIGELSMLHRGITLDKLRCVAPAAPVCVRNCYIRGNTKTCDAGIYLGGETVDGRAAGGILICNNRIFGTGRAIHGENALADLLVAGNIVSNFAQEGIGLTNLASASQRVLIANNTVTGGACGLRFWDDPPYESLRPGQVEVANNLFFESLSADAAFIATPEAGKPASPWGAVAGDLAALAANWRFHRNWRDLSATGAFRQLQIPLGADESKLDSTDVFQSRDAGHVDFLRPKPNAPFTQAGAWKIDPALPPFVGAVPPTGVDAWDWETTWQKSRTKVSEAAH